MAYNLAKWLHILSSTLLFGTGLGSAYYMFFASLTGDAKTVAVVVRCVVRADWWFTTPTVIFQPLSGFYLAHLAGFDLTAPWLAISLGLYLLAGICWLPVVWMQMRMADLAGEAAAQGEPLPPPYWRLMELWTLLGCIAFGALVVVFYLMVVKPF